MAKRRQAGMVSNRAFCSVVIGAGPDNIHRLVSDPALRRMWSPWEGRRRLGSRLSNAYSVDFVSTTPWRVLTELTPPRRRGRTLELVVSLPVQMQRGTVAELRLTEFGAPGSIIDLTSRLRRRRLDRLLSSAGVALKTAAERQSRHA